MVNKVEIRVGFTVDSFRDMSLDNLARVAEMIDQAANERVNLLKSLGDINIRAILNTEKIAEAVMQTRDELGISLMEAKHIVDAIREFRA